MPVAADCRMEVRDARLLPVRDKVRAGERLTREDRLLLFETLDLHGLGSLADHVKSRLYGDRVFFVMNRYVNPTNVCVLSCAFCDFARKKGEAGAFENSIEDVLAMITPGTREAHIVGGHHPDWPFDYYERLIAAIHAARPETQIKAFTAAEVDFWWRRWRIEAPPAPQPLQTPAPPAPGPEPQSRAFAGAGVGFWWRRWRIEPREAPERLKTAGLHSMPGGGAEIFSPRLQKLLNFTGKADADRWCEIHGIAHGLGIKTNATMLYGHVETLEERVDHLLRLREQQDRSGGFLTFIPLAYQVGDTRLVTRQAPPTDDLRTIAASRPL